MMRRNARILLGITLLVGRAATAEDHPLRPSTQGFRPSVPAGLPCYDMDARLDLAERKLVARERVLFTNRSAVAVRELVFHVYPRYRIQDGDRAALSRTLEVLRLSPDEGMDGRGRRMAVSQVRVAGRASPILYDPDVDTVMIVPLERPLEPGGAIEAEVDFSLELPYYWGRWGHHDGVTYLMNWYPVLAHHD